MSYCSIDDLRRILPEKITIGSMNIGTPSPGRSGNQGSARASVSPENARKYISYAEEYIDGRLRPFYSCPLRRIKTYETEVYSNITHGDLVSITVHDSGAFIQGDLIRIQNKNQMETSTISSVPDLTTVVVDRAINDYPASDDTKISILEFPDPIRIITAQLSVAFLLDTYFVAEQSPDVSNYSKTQRNLARGQIENILSGEVLLFGQEHTGRRFVRMSLLDKWSSPAGEVQKGAEKE